MLEQPLQPIKAQPEWWTAFVRFVNRLVVKTIVFLQNLTTFGILFVVFGFWLLVMGIWIRQFSETVVRFYWFFVFLYFVVGFWLI